MMFWIAMGCWLEEEVGAGLDDLGVGGVDMGGVGGLSLEGGGVVGGGVLRKGSFMIFGF